MKKKMSVGFFVLFVVANLFCVTKNDQSQDLSIAKLFKTANAQTEVYYDEHDSGIIDWVNDLFNSDWTQVQVNCYDKHGNLYDIASACDKGDSDICIATSCKPVPNN